MNNTIKGALVISIMVIVLILSSQVVSAEDPQDSSSDSLEMRVISFSGYKTIKVNGPDYTVNTNQLGNINYDEFPENYSGHGWLVMPTYGLGAQLVTQESTVILDPSDPSRILQAFEVYVCSMEDLNLEVGQAGSVRIDDSPDIELDGAISTLTKVVGNEYEIVGTGSNDGSYEIEDPGTYLMYGLGTDSESKPVYWQQNITVTLTDRECTVTFKSEGAVVDEQTVTYGESLTQTDLPRPYREGYALVDWRNGDELFRNGYTITTDVTLEAVWIEMDSDVIAVSGDQVLGNSVTLSVSGYDSGYYFDWLTGDEDCIHIAPHTIGTSGSEVSASSNGYRFVVITNSSSEIVKIGMTYVDFGYIPLLVTINGPTEATIGDTVMLSAVFERDQRMTYNVVWRGPSGSGFVQEGDNCLVTESGVYYVTVWMNYNGTILENVTANTEIVFTETGPIEDDDPGIVAPPIWDDDDEYVPLPPIIYNDSKDEDTVKIVACAAAAVVAAIMAAFLILGNKRE